MRDDHDGKGAPNPDNASTGSALVDYLRAAAIDL
jgi:hypothetical protein